MSAQDTGWIDNSTYNDSFPALPGGDDAGKTSGKRGEKGNNARNNARPTPALLWTLDLNPKIPALDPTNLVADSINAGNVLRTLGGITQWADERKTGGGPPIWWKNMSVIIRACLDALDADATRSNPPSSAADLDESGGSLPRDGGSALAAEGSPLDCGSTGLAKIMERLHAQHLEVMGKLASLSNSPTSSASCSHNAPPAPRSSAPPARPDRQTIAPPQAQSLSLAIAISDLDANSPLRKQSAPELKRNIESQLAASNVPHLSKTLIHSVRRDRTRLHVHAIDAAQKNALLKHPGEWLLKLDPKASIVVRKIALQADLVTTKFDPTSANAITALAASNPTVITDQSVVISVRWLHDSKRGKTPDYSSLIVTVTSADTARDLIHHGICILGENSPVYVQPPTAQQCYRCQGFGHPSSLCRTQVSPRPLACARCASHDHFTSQCECPATVKCTDMRSCTHVKVCCVNCGGPHKAFAAVCPVKADELNKALSSHSYVSLVNELTAAPLAKKSGAPRA